MKICNRCNVSKNLEDFNKDKQSKDMKQSNCRSCQKELMIDFRLSHPDENSNYQKINRDNINKRNRKNYHKRRLKNEIYRQENKGKLSSISANRRCMKLQRTPKWLTKADLKEIEQWYLLVKDIQWLSEEKLEVDHIIPLNPRNKFVSGLHVPWNLQILPLSQHRQKSDRFP